MRPSATKWDFAAAEQTLFDAAQDDLLTLGLANSARSVLADVTHAVLDRGPQGDIHVGSLSADMARQLACATQGVVMLRAAGATVALLSVGYEREAFLPHRVVLESHVRSRQAFDDLSGECARQLLRGRPSKSFRTIAERYGHGEEIALLNQIAHADLATLDLLVGNRTADDPDGELLLQPTRGLARPSSQLFVLAYTLAAQSELQATASGLDVEMPAEFMRALEFVQNNPLPAPH